ncbi:amino acid adenylation domain-containing protein, partial [bacterium]
PFKDLLDRVKEMAIGAFTHQDIPFEQLVEELAPERSLNHSPMFQVMFSYEHNTPQPLKLPGVKTTTFPTNGTGTSKFDLTLSVNRESQGLKARMEYNTDLFHAETIRRMLSHYLALLENVAGNPQQTLSQIPILSPDEKQDILVNWNQTDYPFPEDKTLHGLVEEQMLRTPDAIAAEIGEEKLTYRELDLFSNALAKQLQSAGVGPDVLVGVFLNRSLEMLIALLGVLKAGGAYVPLDPDYPQERLVFMVEDAGVRITLTEKDRLQDLPVKTPEVICIERAKDDKDDGSVETPVSPQNLAYVIYTSGSTGKPKGVLIPHKAVVNFLTTMKDRPGLTQDDVLFSVTSLSFDIAVLELFLPLIVGGKIVIASGEEVYDGKRLLSRLQSSSATVMQATPASWRMLVDSGWSRDLPIKVLVGGEALPEELARQLIERSPSVWNMYGPTETTIWSAIYRLEPDRLNSIGKPIANTRFFVLDSNLLPVPVGVPGELHIGGAGLARGYLNRPNLTKDRFIANPYGKAGERLYKTGDLVRYHKDGSLEYLGRMDNQVKIRGFRIELGEIESVLNNHETIKECAVITYEDKQGNQHIGAYFVSSTSFSTLSLRNFLRKQLPDYMIPNLFVHLDALPLTPNGKVDRKALVAQSHGTQVRQTQFHPPESAIEKQIADIWTSVLDVDKVGTGDNFFDLGGYSLLIMEVISLIENKLNTTVPVKDFFVQTMGQIAAYCEKNQSPE